MAVECSFDIVSEVDLQAVDDVVNVAMKEIQNRFDLKNLNAVIMLNRGEKSVLFEAPSEFALKQVKEILGQKMAKRGLSQKVLSLKKREDASGGTIRETDNIVCGVEKELAKTIVKDIKASGLKVQAAIQDDLVRVSGKSKDDLQSVIQLVRQKDYPIDLQFKNYR